MSESRKLIFDFIEGNLNESEREEFKNMLKSDKNFEKEYLLIKDLHNHMYAKFIEEEALSDKEIDNLFLLSESYVDDYNKEEKKNVKILNYMSKVSSPSDEYFKNQTEDFENDNDFDKLDKQTEGFVKDHFDKNEKNPDILKFINKTKSESDTDIVSKSTEKGPGQRRIYNRNYFIWPVAAAVTAAIIILFINIFNDVPVKERILTEFHTKPEQLSSLTVRDAGITVNEKFNKALKLYKEKDYKEAGFIFNDIFEKDTAFVQVLFYSGLAEFEAGNYETAAEIFNKTIKDYNDYNIEAEWFLSLSYILTDQEDRSYPLLKDIAAQPNMFQDKALSLLKALED